MKNMLNNYYNLYPNVIHKINNEVFFFDDNYKYYIITNFDKEKVMKIVSTTNEYNFINSIIKNSSNSLITTYRKKDYIVERVNIIEDDLLTLKDIVKYQIKSFKSSSKSEIEEYMEIIDFFENKIIDYNKEYPYVQEIFNYFIGLGENSISYLYDTNTNNNTISLNEMKYGLSLKNICKIDNLIISTKTRSIAEYIKTKIILKDRSYVDELEEYLKVSMISADEAKVLYGELLFPSYFFYKLEELINGNRDERYFKILKERIYFIEECLKGLHDIIDKYNKIPRIPWL